MIGQIKRRIIGEERLIPTHCPPNDMTKHGRNSDMCPIIKKPV